MSNRLPDCRTREFTTGDALPVGNKEASRNDKSTTHSGGLRPSGIIVGTSTTTRSFLRDDYVAVCLDKGSPRSGGLR